jgi:hypothetical protein
MLSRGHMADHLVEMAVVIAIAMGLMPLEDQEVSKLHNAEDTGEEVEVLVGRGSTLSVPTLQSRLTSRQSWH